VTGWIAQLDSASWKGHAHARMLTQLLLLFSPSVQGLRHATEQSQHVSKSAAPHQHSGQGSVSGETPQCEAAMALLEAATCWQLRSSAVRWNSIKLEACGL